jgi:hypothetical protein
MTYLEDEATRLFVTAEEEDAEIEAVVDRAVETVEAAFQTCDVCLRRRTDCHDYPDPAGEDSMTLCMECANPPFDSQLRGLPEDDEIVQLLPSPAERVAQAREADVRLRRHLYELLQAERPKVTA